MEKSRRTIETPMDSALEQLNLQLSVNQALETAAEERQRQPDRACNLQRRWQEQRAGKLRNNLADQLFLILTG